ADDIKSDEKPAEAAKPEAASKDFTIIKLGSDGDIKNSEVVDVWKGLFPGGSAPDFNTFDENIRQNVLRGIISERLIYNESDKGADFEKIAKEKSTDKGSGANGGELGWFTKDKMVPAFADAAFKLKKGEISEPVKSDFGWHVIQVEDRRPLQIASYDDMKESL